MDAKGYQRIIEELIKLIDDGVYIVDADGTGLFYNDIMADIEKVNTDDVLGKPFHAAFPGVKLNDSTMYQALKKNIANKNKRQSYVNLHGKDVSTINSTVPVIDNGETIAAIEVARDITNIQTMSDTILELRESRKSRDKSKPKIRKYEFDNIIGKNSDFVNVVERAKRAAQNSASILIYEENKKNPKNVVFVSQIGRASCRERV